MRYRTLILCALLALCAALFMTLGAKGPWSFVLPFRFGKLVALAVVGVAVSTATVLFQTVSNNRILTPSIMGFDALYVLTLTGLVFFLGGQETARLPDTAVFALNSLLMMGLALILFGTLILQARGDIIRMILTGIICATLFRSMTSFWQRLIDPNEFQIIQVNSFARFNQIEIDLLPHVTLITLIILGIVWTMRRKLDVLALGHDAATNLGLNVRRDTFVTLTLTAALVAVSTALVGPIVFLGLLVVSIARMIEPSESHAALIPTAALLSAITLIGGQLVMERVLHLSTPLSVVIDLAGGLIFLWLLLKGPRQ